MKINSTKIIGFIIIACVSFIILLFAERIEYSISENSISTLVKERAELQSAIDKTQYQSAELMLKEKKRLKDLEERISELTGEVSETPNFWFETLQIICL